MKAGKLLVMPLSRLMLLFLLAAESCSRMRAGIIRGKSCLWRGPLSQISIRYTLLAQLGEHGEPPALFRWSCTTRYLIGYSKTSRVEFS